ncbi:MAG: FAD-dependent oxidoreductase [Pseudomonadota bacterium]
MSSIAVIGSGIAGNAAAWALQCFSNHSVTLFEKRLRPGGHSATVDIDYDGHPLAVDTGFIVYNTANYPNLCALFSHLKVPTEWSDMSLGISVGDGALEWSGDRPSSLFAQRRNLVSPRFYAMLASILRFNRNAARHLKDGSLQGITLGEYLEQERFPKGFVDDYLVPMGAAIWSTPDAQIMQFPAESFIQFFANHRLLEVRPPEWRTVRGGSREYVKKLLQPLDGRILLGRAVTQIQRTANGVEISSSDGQTRTFDYAILASHSDQSLAMLSDATQAEASVLSAIPYLPNEVYLHRDPNLMPKRRDMWSAWNYMSAARQAEGRSGVSVSYWMNKLQNISKRTPVFISLNPFKEPAPEKTFLKTTYDHPQYSAEALAAQKRLPDVNGSNRIWFAGAWTGYGFHEDGLRSGLEAAEALGAQIPWRPHQADSVSQPILPVAAE